MFRMTVEDVFFIRGRGLVATGKVADGMLRVGDEVRLNGQKTIRVDGIEAFRKTLEQANAGDNIGVLFKSAQRGDVNPGDVLSVDGVPGDVSVAAPAAVITPTPFPEASPPRPRRRRPRHRAATRGSPTPRSSARSSCRCATRA